ncbi:DNA polymerase [Streptomyces antimycoticus]|uniref:DNA polymerase n=1 Tax=Streptomyces antimycoticus TaxID=68175 RepID=UPI00341AD5D5
MREYRETLGGQPWTGYALETVDDIAFLWRWLKTHQPRTLAFDSETGGLRTYSGDALRTAQFGTADTAFVIPTERGEAFREVTRDILRKVPELEIHNAPFDLQVVDRYLGVTIEELEQKVRDTKILAHLCDSRKDFEGGVGHSLKPLSAYYLDPSVPDTQKDLERRFRELKTGHTRANPVGWRTIPYEDEIYQRYACLDVIALSRLRPILERQLVELEIPATLIEAEHRLMAICCRMERKGMILDVEYTSGLVGRLEEQAAEHAAIAARYGVDNVNSTRQVTDALQGMGESWDEVTDTGAPAVGKEVLLPMADLDDKWQRLGVREPNPLADAVLHSKRAAKWRKSYALAMLENRDENDRIHPRTTTLGAKTGRASVSDPPLQQLPSKGWEIRRCILAPEGEVYWSVDQSSVELVVLAALSGDPNMCEAVKSGRNLHDYTATLMYGPEFTKHQRAMAKIGGLGASYQGGPTTLAKMTGLPVADMKDVMGRYMRSYPTLRPWFKALQRDALANGCQVRTPSGRLLRLDRDRLYKVVAYVCQSTARDTMCQAIINLDAKGMTSYLTQWIHDEVIGTAPAAEAQDVAMEVAATVEMNLFGIPIRAGDPDPSKMVYGRSWAHGYGLPAEWDIR